MNMKATAIAPSNIAFIKYWGKKNEDLRLPTNGSISMNLSSLTTTTTVEFSQKYRKDVVIIDNKRIISKQKERVIKHLDRIREISSINLGAKVVSKNSFPVATGLSSSASGFAALTMSASVAAGLNLSKRKLSILARQASGSACRSIPDGFVEWIRGDSSENSYAVSLYPPDYWSICDVVVVVDDQEKKVTTTESQSYALSSPFFRERLRKIEDKILLAKKFIKEKNFSEFGQLIEDESLELHAVMLTAKPSMIFWRSGTVRIMRLVRKWRSEGLPVYFTVNTGHNVHLICKEQTTGLLCDKLGKLIDKRDLIVSKPSIGARITDSHLF